MELGKLNIGQQKLVSWLSFENNFLTLSYILFIKGEYYIDVFYANQLTNGSPFKSNVFDSSKIKITPNHSGVVGQVVKFEGDLVIIILFL